MSIAKGSFVCLAFVLTMTTGSARAQTATRNFDSLSGTVQPGDLVYVTDTTGKERAATILELASAFLKVEMDGAPRELQPGLVRRIQVPRRDSVWNGVIIGGAIGAGLGGLGSVAGECTPSPACVVWGILGQAGIGAALGWLADEMYQKRVTVYEARTVVSANSNDERNGPNANNH